MSTQTLRFLIVVISGSFDHQTVIFCVDFITNCVRSSSDNENQTFAAQLGILSPLVLWGNGFGF